ncbi:uncharacterized protein BCR38DRAFT_73802 [Pseudomassariella vexata]|uniref:Uncharacterized protein n=1 Tax=Pseudomassariella vexata TaxID=1141098 RepID=A0A1Y2DGV9_9PEZI|nr:uncharacterized protein BCR38DRAFT_73802 [Pseudomassariella vexata]ORY58498.1 hypothetical protein BCR38DRAFT_73802 [Pseudomassariella vexata]
MKLETNDVRKKRSSQCNVEVLSSGEGKDFPDRPLVAASGPLDSATRGAFLCNVLKTGIIISTHSAFRDKYLEVDQRSVKLHQSLAVWDIASPPVTQEPDNLVQKTAIPLANLKCIQWYPIFGNKHAIINCRTVGEYPHPHPIPPRGSNLKPPGNKHGCIPQPP